MTDPVADLLTRIRNAQLAHHDTCVVPKSKLKLAIANILKDEGYVEDVTEHSEGPQGSITVTIKYDGRGLPAIEKAQRVSRPGRRQYVGKDEIPRVLAGMGISILSTSRGVMVGRKARELGVGGEVLCSVY
ncbi:MAG: 30S ribosomal protein S8 [Deltaproteobacteria bacterium]|nr:30S ribosomal protein S8 [Deltaproteobacteria bacterium]